MKTTIKTAALKPNATAKDLKVIKAEATRRTFKAPGKRQASLYLIRNMNRRTPALLVEAHLEVEALKFYRQKYPAKSGDVMSVINLTPVARQSKLVLIVKRKIG